MSAKLMGEVWEIDGLSHGEQLVMLALADHGEDDGTQIFPSVARLAWKTGYKERQVQNILRALEEKGLIEPVAYSQGGRGHATEFKMNTGKGAKKPQFEKGAKSERVQNPAQRVQSSTRKGAKSSTKGAIAIAPQPSENHQIQPSVEPSRVAADAAPPPPSKPVLSEPKTAPQAANPKKTGRAVQETPEETAYYRACVPMMARAAELDLKVDGVWGQCQKALRALYHAEVRPTPDLIEREFVRRDGYWYTQFWKGRDKNEPPEPHDFPGNWKRAMTWRDKPPLAVVNGKAQPRAAPPQEDGIAALRARLTGQPPDGGFIEGRFRHG